MLSSLEYSTVVLAALLHDIGKFLQRGRSLPFDIEGPHPEVSARFISAFPQTFGQVADPELLKLLVLHHHRGHGFTGLRADDIAEERPRLLAFLVNKADGLSSSERGQHTTQWQDYKTVPLASLFPRLFAAERKGGVPSLPPFSAYRSRRTTKGQVVSGRALRVSSRRA